MAVDNPAVIDIVGIDARSGEVVLTISDHLEWDEPNEHVLVLQEKLNRYLAFVESGELSVRYAGAHGRRVRIDVCCQHAPSPLGEQFLRAATSIVEQAGLSLTWRT